MNDQTPEPNPYKDPALLVNCPYEGGCGAPAGTPCHSAYGTHAERRRLHELRTLEHGVCALCRRPMVRGTVEGVHDAWHPDPADHSCPPIPDPAVDWNGYALAAQQGLVPGHPGPEHFVPNQAIVDAAAIQVHGSGGYDDPDARAVYAGTGPLGEDLPPRRPAVCPECVNGKHVNCDRRAMDPVTDELVPCTCAHGAPA